MTTLFRYLALCVFEGNPADLVPSKAFMRNNALYYFLSGWLVEGLIADPADGLLEVLLRIVMAFSLISIFLLVTKRWEIFYQLFTAIFVCENLIMTLATATEALEFYMTMKHVEHGELIAISIAVLLVVWYVSIVGYILRQFFHFSVRDSLLFSTSYFVLTYGLPMMALDM
ncbi:MAG: hypothetical protein KAH08_06815 [Methylococcales bacterium]|nr:hypothetical protein [Methylococcales bacterium]